MGERRAKLGRDASVLGRRARTDRQAAPDQLLPNCRFAAAAQFMQRIA